MTTASARIIAAASPTVCAVLSSECVTTVDNSGVYVYYLKGIVFVCFRCPARTMGFSGTHLYLCTTRAQGGGPSVIPKAGIHYKLRRL